MLRLTTNVTVSPASSARSSSAAARMSSIASGRVSANIAVISSRLSSMPARARSIVAGWRSGRGPARRPEPRRGMKLQYFVLMTSSTPWATHSGSMYSPYTHSRSVSATPSSRQALADLVRGGERVLGRDVVAVGGQPAEVGRARGDELRPPVGEVGRHLDADAGQQPLRLGDQALHVVERDRRRPLREVALRPVADPGAPVLLRRLLGDLGRLLPVVALVRDEVLEDDLLDVVEPGERLERRDPLLLGLADPDEDPARERDLQLAGGADRVEPRLRVLGRRALVGDEVGVDRLQHQPLRGGHLAQARQVLLRQDAEVGVREQPALERPLADPGDVGGEVGVPELGELLRDARVVVGRLAGQDQQLLDVAARGAVEDPLDLLGLVQVRLVRRERAVLAVAPARPGERQREVARESDPSAHPAPSYAARVRMRLLLLALVLFLGGCGGGAESERPERAGHAAARLHAQRGPRGDLRRHRPRLRRRRGRPARRSASRAPRPTR